LEVSGFGQGIVALRGLGL